MTIEEKAKAYDEALELARDYYKANLKLNNADENLLLEDIFPELKESEDEKIRKALIRFHKSTIDVDGIKGDDIIAWLEKQGESYTKKDVDDAYLKGICDAKHELEKQGEQKPFDKVEPFDKYEGLTDFERTLADICIGWIGEELGWKQYIKDNADVLLKIAIEMFNSIQDAPFEQKSAAWSDEDENYLQSAENACEYQYGKNTSTILWLKHLKDRIGG